MSAQVLQMSAARTTSENFLRVVGTIERSVNITIHVIANEDGSNRLCEITLPNQEGAAGRLCVALLDSEDVAELIGALTAFQALP
jgi:hypothetical protein